MHPSNGPSRSRRIGGTRNGLVISWPKRIKDGGEIRSQFHHVIDIVPTILEAAGIQAPLLLNGTPQKPLEGVSMVYTFDDAKAPTRHTTQYFEMTANRALYHDDWIASTTPARLPWETIGAAPDPDDYQWELYNLADDFSQAKNVAKDRSNTTYYRLTPVSPTAWIHRPVQIFYEVRRTSHTTPA